jgi:hypothetical protein
MESTTTAEASAAEPSGAASADARKSVVALHPRGSAVMIAAKDAVVIGVAALLKSRRPKALTAAAPFISTSRATFVSASRATFSPTAVEAATRNVAGSPSAETIRHRAIPIGHTQPMSRIMRPCGMPHRIAVKMIEAVPMKERMVQDNDAAIPVRAPAPAAPAPAAPSAKIEPGG